jgi:hypothetical protein
MLLAWGDSEVMAESAAVLRKARARFAYLHGSRAFGQYRPDSDVDIAAYFGGQPPNAFDILLPPGVDLLVLDHAPLELAGRVAARGRLLFLLRAGGAYLAGSRRELAVVVLVLVHAGSFEEPGGQCVSLSFARWVVGALTHLAVELGQRPTEVA